MCIQAEREMVNLPDTEIINDIISREWEMFQQTTNAGGRASCQDDYDTFYGMRFGQFVSWSQDVLESYLNDLKAAEQAGRNLIAEKYLNMMEHTYPEEYELQKAALHELSAEHRALADTICEEMISMTIPLREEFPRVCNSGRPLRSSEDLLWGPSVETYQRGELYTYSYETLTALKKHIDTLRSQGLSLARLILENSVRHYGYESLEKAEKAIGRASE